MIVPKSLNERPVAPGPPAKSVSPVNTALSPAAQRQHDPGLVCPSSENVPGVTV